MSTTDEKLEALTKRAGYDIECSGGRGRLTNEAIIRAAMTQAVALARAKDRALIERAVEAIDGLAGQQAMPDDFYRPILAALRARLEGEG